jgi:glycosyltransferase involved in cell wall biosynthesis
MAIFGFASYEIHPTTPGGAGVFLDATIELLVSHRHAVVLILGLPAAEFEVWIKEDLFRYSRPDLISSYHLDRLCDDIDAERRQFPSNAHWDSYRFAYALRKVSVERRCDYFEFFDYCGPAYYSLLFRAGALAEFPSIIGVRIHNTIEMIDRSTRSPFEEFRINDYALERASISLADIVLCSGQRFMHDEVLSLYNVSAQKLVLSPLPCRIPQTIDRNPDARDIVFLGRFSTFKGVDRFLHAAVAILSNKQTNSLIGKFIIIGPSETVSSAQSETALRDIAREWIGKRIILTGRLTHKEMTRYLTNAACAVFPNRMESFCYAAHELYLQGIPLILSTSPTFLDFFCDGENALFFDNRISSLISCILRLVSDRPLNQRLSRSSLSSHARYQKCLYETYANFPVANVQAGSDLTITYFVFGASYVSAIKSVKAMSSALPFGEWLILLKSDSGARIRLFGAWWEAKTITGTSIYPQVHPINDCFIFIDTARPPTAEFVKGAVAILSRYPEVGAVVPSCESVEATWNVSSLPVSIEMSAANDAVIGALFRADSKVSLVDMFATGENESELAHLIRLREKKSCVVDWPGKAWSFEYRNRVALPPNVDAKFLRRYAWSLNPVVMSIAADRFRQTRGFLARGDAVTEQQLSLISVEAEANPNRVYVVANAKTARLHGDFGFVTLVRVFAGYSAIGRPWNYMEFDGSWESLHVADYAAGFRRTSARMACASTPIDRSLRLNFLVGPDQGHVTLIHKGKIWDHCLTADKYDVVGIAVGEVFANAPDVNDRLDSVRQIAPPRWTNMSVWPNTVAMIAGEEDRLVMRLVLESKFGDCASQIPIISLDVGNCGSMASVEKLKQYGQSRTIIALLNWDFAETVAAAVTQAINARFQIVLWHSLNWKQGFSALLALERIAEVAKYYPNKVNVTVFNENLKDVLARLGISYDLEAFSITDSTIMPAIASSLNVIIGPAPRQFSSFGHVAGALGLVAQGTMQTIRTIYIPRNGASLRTLLHAFGLGHKTFAYEDPEFVIHQVKDSLPIYLAPWPIGDFDAFAISTICAGGIAIVGRGAVPQSISGINRISSMEYWEDSTDIALELEKMICLGQELIRTGGAGVSKSDLNGHNTGASFND